MDFIKMSKKSSDGSTSTRGSTSTTTTTTTTSTPLHIAVLTGGYSGEADVSRRSAAVVMEHVDRTRFVPYLVHIDPDSWWVEHPETSERTPVDKETLAYKHTGNTTVQADLAFVMVHGTPGEDGQLQAHLDLCGIPHTTASARVMATTFHKGWTTALLRDAGISVARSVECLPSDRWDETRQKEVLESLGLPCFVKPSESGSSLGITRVTQRAQLWPAVLEARKTGTSTVLIEARLKGREFTCGIIPDGLGGIQVLPITEIVSDNDFFDYAAKYDGQSHEITPAQLDPRDTSALQDQAVMVYQTLHVKGMARVDMMMENGGEPHVMEINTVPGFSTESIIPQQANVAGIDKANLISRLIDEALRRQAK